MAFWLGYWYMKLLLATAIWGRAPLTRIVLDYYARMARLPGLDLQLLCATSRTPDTAMVRDLGWNTVVVPNDPLSQKHNAMFEAAREINPDAIILTGSDDLIQEPVFRYYDKHYSADAPHFVGLKQIWFYNIDDHRALYWDGWLDRLGRSRAVARTVGAGRIFSRRVLETMHYRPWGEHIMPRGLDTISFQEMRKRGIGELSIDMATTGGIVCDFKYRRENLTAFRLLTKYAQERDPGILAETWPEEFRAIQGLRETDLNPQA
jgi:hypothetical protein